jgi:UDP-glucose 4-epimerase
MQKYLNKSQFLDASTKISVNTYSKQHTSSAAVYGNPDFLPISEDHPTNPISNYGVGKLACENYLRASCSTQNQLDAVSLRFFNVFGPGQNEDSAYAGVITKFINAVKKGQPPVIYGDGTQTRDFVSVENIAKACCEAMISRHTFQGKPINIASGSRTSINEIWALVKEAYKSEVNPIFIKKTNNEIIHSQADNRLLKKLFA